MNKKCKPNIIIPDKYSVVVVQNITERNDISCKLRQNGMIAIVVEEGYAQYQIQTKEGIYSVCNNNAWTQIETGDKVFDGNNLIIINNEEHKQEYLLSPLSKIGQMLFYVPENKYYKYDGVDFIDPFPNKLDKPLGSTMDPDNKLIPVYGQSGDNPEWLSPNTLGKVESVNGVGVIQGTKNINLNLSDIPDNVGYATDTELTQLAGELGTRIGEVEGINYTWNPTNRTLTLFDTSGRQMSQVSLVSLDNEGTDLRYNSATKSLELYNADNQLLDSIPVFDFVGNVGTALQLNSNVLQLKDSQGNILSSVSFDVSNISGLQSLLDSKLDKTTTTVAAPDATFKYVYLTDETNNVRRMLAGDLGKNVANSSLTSVAGAGLTLDSSWTLNTNGQLYSVTNLPNKSADTSFNRMMVQNSTGQVAWGNGNTLIKNMPALLSDAEKTTWKTEMNGGWTTNTMSIALINPIVIQKIDTIQYVTLLGANLNLNPTNFSVEIVNNTEVVIASIPGSQVQLQSNGLSLIFYYNFKDLPLGSYKIRLWNGVAYYVSQISFQVLSASNIYEVDQSLISWTFDFLTKAEGGSYNDHITSSGSIELGSMVKNSANVTYSNTETTLIAAALSSELIVDGIPLTLNDNFYIELEFVGNHIASCHQGGISKDSTASLLSSFIASTKFIYGYNWVLLPSSQSVTGIGTVPTKLIIAKTGNLLTLVMSSSGGTCITSVTASSSSPVRLRLNKYLFDNDPTYKTTMNLISAYKF